jgi:hypothetical protein
MVCTGFDKYLPRIGQSFRLGSAIALFGALLLRPAPAAILQITPSTGGGADVRVAGTNGQSWRLLSSSTLLNWTAIGTNLVGSDGTALFHVSSPGVANHFYRAELMSVGRMITALSPAFTDVSNA